MNTKQYRLLFYIIVVTITATIGVQLYWNYQNYEENKQRVSNEILLSLNNTVESYYSGLSKKNFFSIVSNVNPEGLSIFKNLNPKDSKKRKTDLKITSLKITTDDPSEYEKLPELLDSILIIDSITSKTLKHRNRELLDIKGDKIDYKVFNGKQKMDSLNLIKGIQSVFIAFKDDKIKFEKFDSIFSKELEKYNIKTDYYFNYYVADSLNATTAKDSIPFQNKLQAKSTYLRSNQSLFVFHDDTTFDVLKKSFTGILISLLLALVIISTLFYLLSIINNQKELASIKNDLISNITHEFKTPITTISTALEAIDNFNAINDKEKTKKYLNMSSQQLNKLHLMVEKLLETATLDSESLLLKKSQQDLVQMCQKLVEKNQELHNYKSISFSTNSKEVVRHIDDFHFENVISNLIDNAIKYGGEEISIEVNAEKGQTTIRVNDNGKGIDKNQQEKIFEKFYRVPKGNTHDVKGFGIGLYYCRKIVEKHNGTIQLSSDNNSTTFIITLPNE
ncbi:MAG: two-component sensor histidine kinase [Flavobacteriaceae bacterium]|nr:two-component sensor histidine kinase [Flavobacteriaceae bacterium]|tara:strand:+ start:76129 stop:77646 length:1518 start_codon:yes stop_codon:yes gene_type:complete